MIINKALYPVSGTIQTITNMHKTLENLQLQLATGNRYNTLAEMGRDRVHHLNLEARLDRIAGYKANITTVENRLSFYTNGLERLDEIEADARALAMPGAFGTDGINLANVKNQATNMLKEVIDVLNTDITGQYIFGGNASDRQPVTLYDEIMNGANGKAGFLQVRNERLAADTANGGRLVVGNAPADTVSITEDGDHLFGFKLSSMAGGVSANGAPYATVSNIAAPFDPANPAANTVSVQFTDVSALQAGDEITIGLTYPDNRARTETITLKATDRDPPPAGSYLISTDPDPAVAAAETAQNFQAALEAELGRLSDTKLMSASTYAAADNFFNGTGEPVMRTAGGPPADQLVADTDYDNTVRWYNGQDSANPRQVVTANVDENTRVNYGVQANETGFAELIKGLAVFAATDFLPLFDENGVRIEENAARYDAMVDIQRGRLSESNNAKPGSIEGIAMELGLAAATVNTVKARHTQYTAQLETMLADISVAPREEVAMMLLTLQTQLQASYQATAMASQLTLVNYLR